MGDKYRCEPRDAGTGAPVLDKRCLRGNLCLWPAELPTADGGTVGPPHPESIQLQVHESQGQEMPHHHTGRDDVGDVTYNVTPPRVRTFIITGCLAGLDGGACNSRPRGHEFEPQVGYGVYLESKSLKNK